MNEDEAFIRAIVDSPGDDLPRLVYADWLDDRDDPRGPYLRAESEWAMPWRNGERPENNPELRELSAGLNAMWVARISRPPMGVCCEHIRFEGSGPQLSNTDIDTGERELELELPPEYRAFLLNYNGGRPVPVTSTNGVVGSEVGRPIERFDSLDVVAAPPNHPLRHWLNVPEHPNLRHCIPVGTTNADSDAIYLRCAGARSGRVYVWRECNSGDIDPDLVELLARNFAVLLSMMRIRNLH